MVLKIKLFISHIYSIYCLLLTFKEARDNILTDKETVKYLKENKKSLIRLGDGEFRIMLKKRGIPYQEYTDELRDEMLEIMNDYFNVNQYNQTEYLLSIPQEFMTCSGWWLLKKPLTYLWHWGWIRKYYRFNMNRASLYGDAFLFSKGNENIYKQLFLELDNVVFVHREQIYADEFAKNYNIKTKFIRIPPSNSYKFIDDIEKEIKKNVFDKNIPILISAGPTAKILAYRLSKKGYIVYDTGHCWDDPLYMPI